MSSLANIGVRTCQILFAAIVCGLSIDLARGHKWGPTPITLGYVSFVGCVSLLAAFAGMAATWIESLQGAIMMLVDGFITLINLAGGLLIAIKMRGITCKEGGSDSNGMRILNCDLINGGKHGKEIWDCYYCQDSNANRILSRCRMNQADAAFMFLTVIVLLVSLTLTFLRERK